MTTARVEPCYAIIGRNIREARKERGFTQDDLATLLRRSRNSIARIEIGYERMMIHTIANIAYHLRCTPMRLMRGMWN